MLKRGHLILDIDKKNRDYSSVFKYKFCFFLFDMIRVCME